MNIYQINQSLVALTESLPDTGELTDEALAQLEQLELAKEEKQKNIILYAKNLALSEEAIENERNHLLAMKKRQTAKKEALMRLLEYSMGTDLVVDFQTCGAKFKKNPPKVTIQDENKVPAEFIVIKEVKSIDKTALKNELKAGKEIEGCELVQESRLTIY